MKKTCNRCGHQLDIDKRCCTSCGAFNPYFIAGFKTPAIQSEMVEEKRLEEEKKIEAELAEKEKREQKIQRELEEAEKRHQERLKEMMLETTATPVVVEKSQGEISDKFTTQPESIAPVASGSLLNFEYNDTPVAEQAYKSARPKRWMLVTAVLVVLLTMGGSLIYFYSVKSTEPNSSALHAEISPVPNAVSNATNSNTNEVPFSNSVDTVKPQQKAQVITAAISRNKEVTPAAPVKAKHTTDFVLTSAKVRADLVGRKLSGCGITIRKAGDIVSLGTPVYVEQLPSGYMKYRVAARVVQGNETYNSTPYVYYKADGSFIKVDGTNCE